MSLTLAVPSEEENSCFSVCQPPRSWQMGRELVARQRNTCVKAESPGHRSPAVYIHFLHAISKINPSCSGVKSCVPILFSAAAVAAASSFFSLLVLSWCSGSSFLCVRGAWLVRLNTTACRFRHVDEHNFRSYHNLKSVLSHGESASNLYNDLGKRTLLNKWISQTP